MHDALKTFFVLACVLTQVDFKKMDKIIYDKRLIAFSIMLCLSACGESVRLEFTEGLPSDDVKCKGIDPKSRSVTQFAQGNTLYQFDTGQMLICDSRGELVKSYVSASSAGRPVTHVYIKENGLFDKGLQFLPSPMIEESNQPRSGFFGWLENLFGETFAISLAAGIGAFIFGRLFITLRSRRKTETAEAAIHTDEPQVVWDHSSFPATEVVRSLAAGAVLCTANGFPLNIVSPQRSTESMREWLNSSWHIDNAQDFDYQFQYLLNFGHAYIFDRIVQLSNEHREMRTQFSQHAFDVLAKEFADDVSEVDLKEHLEYFPGAIQHLAQLGYIDDQSDIQLSTKAYDIDRAVTISRVTLGAGHIPNKIALDYVMAAGNCARYYFSSWQEFGASLLLGRAIWGGVENPNVDFDYRIKTVEMLLNDPESPWVKVGWWTPPKQDEMQSDQAPDGENEESNNNQKPTLH